MGFPFTFSTLASGELAGSTSAAQNPNVAARMIKFKANATNAGNVYIGRAGVTVSDGSTDTTTGWPLAAGEETPWLPLGNVNETYRITDNAGDECFYWALR